MCKVTLLIKNAQSRGAPLASLGRAPLSPSAIHPLPTQPITPRCLNSRLKRSERPLYGEKLIRLPQRQRTYRRECLRCQYGEIRANPKTSLEGENLKPERPTMQRFSLGCAHVEAGEADAEGSSVALRLDNWRSLPGG